MIGGKKETSICSLAASFRSQSQKVLLLVAGHHLAISHKFSSNFFFKMKLFRKTLLDETK